MAEEAKPTLEQATGTESKTTEAAKRPPPQFIPKLKGKPVIVRMQDGRPIKGVLKAYNNYELLVEQKKGSIILFKGAIASVEG